MLNRRLTGGSKAIVAKVVNILDEHLNFAHHFVLFDFYTALFFAILNNLHSQEATQIITFTLVFLGLALALCTVWQYLSRTDKVPALSAWLESVFFAHKRWYFTRLYAPRGSGTYINPNHLAGLLEMLLPLALAFALAGRNKPVLKVMLGYTALVILVAIGMTGSRGSWAATGRCWDMPAG